jgi:hypothetical protein
MSAWRELGITPAVVASLGFPVIALCEKLGAAPWVWFAAGAAVVLPASVLLWVEVSR